MFGTLRKGVLILEREIHCSQTFCAIEIKVTKMD